MSTLDPPEDAMSDDLDPAVSPAPEALTDTWAARDVVDTTPYDDAFFDALADDIEAAVDEATVTRMPRRWPPAVAAVAAALLLGWFLLPTEGPTELASAPTPTDETSLEALARGIGRAATADLFDPEIDSTSLFASADWTTVDDDEVPGTYTSLLEQLDQLDASDVDTLFTPL